MVVDVWVLLEELAARVGTPVVEVVEADENSGAVVTITMLTTVEACPAEFDVMEVKVWVDDSSEIVASVVTVTVTPPESQSACVSFDSPSEL